MRKRNLLILPIVLTLGLVAGCWKSDGEGKVDVGNKEVEDVGGKLHEIERFTGNVTEEEGKAIKVMIEDNIKAMSEGDLEVYMSGFDKQDESYSLIEVQMEELFEEVEVSSKLIDFEVVGKKDDMYQVEVLIETKFSENEKFGVKDNLTKSYQYLKKVEDRWVFAHVDVLESKDI